MYSCQSLRKSISNNDNELIIYGAVNNVFHLYTIFIVFTEPIIFHSSRAVMHLLIQNVT